MTDKELLELAAKAHGGLVQAEPNGDWIHEDDDGNRGAWWNPLSDDGDALRLAIKLTLEIDICLSGVAVRTPNGSKILITSKDEPNFYIATRIAIVQAAAAIGRTK